MLTIWDIPMEWPYDSDFEQRTAIVNIIEIILNNIQWLDQLQLH